LLFSFYFHCAFWLTQLTLTPNPNLNLNLSGGFFVWQPLGMVALRNGGSTPVSALCTRHCSGPLVMSFQLVEVRPYSGKKERRWERHNQIVHSWYY